ncbi:hypothetical protein N7466_011529 [Penicillium verhagenii]|uniref:uncharacterized protein n=1 Tax=Penicillium verhagenii TaxID=1562060 RepID=UPI00254527D9|nr:uncharacterized protein N7466_011529 [Penicillium verhagenii]KAJ5915596.1 hypothetical protein N7466_011529 [Penicillium verhagenii]
MDRSSEQENPDQMPTESLDIVVADVASALVQAIGRSRPGSKGIHRSLRTSLVTLMVDLKSANTIQALASRKPLQRCLQQIAESLNGILRDDYVRREYPNSLARPSIQPSSPFLPRILAFLVNKTAVPSPSDAVERWILHPLPILGMFHEIVSSSETWQVQLDDFLTQDERLFVQLNALIKDWNSLVDQLYDSGHLDDDSDDKNYPMPPKLQAGISTEESVHHLSQSLYNILHGTWPCHSDEHDHNGRLGCCVQARFCLDPQWSSKDRKNDSFFVLLTGPDILQECRVCPKNRG